MDDEIEASAFHKEEDLEREDIAAVSCTTNHTFFIYIWNAVEAQNIC